MVVAFALTLLVLPRTWRQIVGAPAYFALLYIAGCVVIIPLDRLFDERFRRLEKLKDKTIAA